MACVSRLAEVPAQVSALRSAALIKLMAFLRPRRFSTPGLIASPPGSAKAACGLWHELHDSVRSRLSTGSKKSRRPSATCAAARLSGGWLLEVWLLTV